MAGIDATRIVPSIQVSGRKVTDLEETRQMHSSDLVPTPLNIRSKANTSPHSFCFQVSENLVERRQMLSQSSTSAHAKASNFPAETDMEYIVRPKLEENWQLGEIPRELQYVDDDTPPGICNIVKETFEQFQATRESMVDVQTQSMASVTSEELIQIMDGPLLESFYKASQRAGSSVSTSSFGSSDINSQIASRQLSSESITTSLSSIDTASDSISKSTDQGPSNRLLGPSVPRKNSITIPGKFSKRSVFMKVFRGSDDRTISLRPNAYSASASSTYPPPTPPPKECASCFEDVNVSIAISLSCQHSYCSECFSQLLTTAMQHENFWPPKCCLQEIPRKTIVVNTSKERLAEFDLKAKEYAEPAGERLYCPKPECGKWFNKSQHRSSDSAVSCTYCNFQMCQICRDAAHPAGARCPRDRGLDATLAAAELEGWRRCYSCQTMVELRDGCRHITCKCRAEFCYTCGAKWRTCRCTEDDQIRRRRDLATRREVARHEAAREEAELQAALQAVAEQEQRDAAEAYRVERERIEREDARQAEEIRKLQELEAARVRDINTYYIQLRILMKHLHLSQRARLRTRHEAQKKSMNMATSNHLLEERNLQEQKETAGIRSSQILQDARQKHAREFIETCTRHRADQDRLYTKMNEMKIDSVLDEIARATKLEELMILQEDERTSLRDQQAHELRRLQNRVNVAQLMDPAMEKAEPDREKQSLREKAQKLDQQMYSDRKWFSTIMAERFVILSAEETRLIDSGADAPVHMSNRSTSQEELRSLVRASDSRPVSASIAAADSVSPDESWQQRTPRPLSMY